MVCCLTSGHKQGRGVPYAVPISSLCKRAENTGEQEVRSKMLQIFPNVLAMMNLIMVHFSSKKKSRKGEHRGRTGMMWNELRFLGKYMLFLLAGI